MYGFSTISGNFRQIPETFEENNWSETNTCTDLFDIVEKVKTARCQGGLARGARVRLPTVPCSHGCASLLIFSTLGSFAIDWYPEQCVFWAPEASQLLTSPRYLFELSQLVFNSQQVVTFSWITTVYYHPSNHNKQSHTCDIEPYQSILFASTLQSHRQCYIYPHAVMHPWSYLINNNINHPLHNSRIVPFQNSYHSLRKVSPKYHYGLLSFLQHTYVFSVNAYLYIPHRKKTKFLVSAAVTNFPGTASLPSY